MVSLQTSLCHRVTSKVGEPLLQCEACAGSQPLPAARGHSLQRFVSLEVLLSSAVGVISQQGEVSTDLWFYEMKVICVN